MVLAAMRTVAAVLSVFVPVGVVYAQSTGVEGLAGSAGWAGAGLLGLVLFWLLLKHLPEKDRQITELVARNDQRLDAQAAVFKSEQAADRQLHERQLTAEREACEKHFATLSSSTQASFENLSHSTQASFKAIGDLLQSHATRNQQWIELLKKQESDAKGKKPGGQS
jgi:ABC-type nickel/cobalt efflux system permease component RcnA